MIFEENNKSNTYTINSNDQEKLTRKSFKKSKEKTTRNRKKLNIVPKQQIIQQNSELQDVLQYYGRDRTSSIKTKEKFKQSPDKTLTIEDFSNKSNNDITEILYKKKEKK